MAIFRNDGAYVHGSNTRVDHISLGEVEDEGIIALTYDELNLLNGTFFIDVAIYDEHCMTTYDYLKHSYYFKIQDDTGNEGIYKISHKYEVARI